MKPEEIKNTEFYKSLSKLSNNDRGILFEQHSNIVEDRLKVKLIKHQYTELNRINTNNPTISYQENHSLIALMEFLPNP